MRRAPAAHERPSGADEVPVEDNPAPARGVVALLIDLFVAPGQAFAAIAARPRVLAPMVLSVALHAAFAAVWLERVDLVELTRNQALAAGREPPPAAASQAMAGGIRVAVAVSLLLMPPLIMVVVAGVLAFAFNFGLGSEAPFRACLAVVAWTFAALALVSLPATLGVMWLRGDWNSDPQSVLATHVGAFVDPLETAPALFSLLRSLDVVSLWVGTLLSLGMARASGRPTRTAALVVFGLWLAYVTIKVALAALF